MKKYWCGRKPTLWWFVIFYGWLRLCSVNNTMTESCHEYSIYSILIVHTLEWNKRFSDINKENNYNQPQFCPAWIQPQFFDCWKCEMWTLWVWLGSHNLCSWHMHKSFFLKWPLLPNPLEISQRPWICKTLVFWGPNPNILGFCSNINQVFVAKPTHEQRDRMSLVRQFKNTHVGIHYKIYFKSFLDFSTK